jgi:hypothetical protein
VRRRFAALAALVLCAGACANTDYDAPKLAAAVVVVRTEGAHALAVGPNGTLFFGSPTGEVLRVDALHPATPELVWPPVFQGPLTLLGIAARADVVVMSYVHMSECRLEVIRKTRDGAVAVWVGPKVSPHTAAGQLVFESDGRLLVAVGTRILRLVPNGRSTQQPSEVSAGWIRPSAFTVDDRGRLWVADQARPDGRELVARGRERNGAKRRRFASALPARSTPTGLAAAANELYVCRPGQHDLYRLHIGLDEVARRRVAVPGLSCDGGVVSMPDGSLITATAHDIRRYRAR